MIGRKVMGAKWVSYLAHMSMKLNMNELSSNLAREKKTQKRLIDHKRMAWSLMSKAFNQLLLTLHKWLEKIYSQNIKYLKYLFYKRHNYHS